MKYSVGTKKNPDLKNVTTYKLSLLCDRSREEKFKTEFYTKMGQNTKTFIVKKEKKCRGIHVDLCRHFR